MTACASSSAHSSCVADSKSDEVMTLTLAVERVTESNERLLNRLLALEARVSKLETLGAVSPDTLGVAASRMFADATHLQNRADPLNAGEDTISPSAQTRSSLKPAVHDSVERMCDCCFAITTHCFPCAKCGKEWYCSEQCQRLRETVHGSRCRKLQQSLGSTG